MYTLNNISNHNKYINSYSYKYGPSGNDNSNLNFISGFSGYGFSGYGNSNYYNKGPIGNSGNINFNYSANGPTDISGSINYSANGPTGNNNSNLNFISGFSGYGNSTYYNNGPIGNSGNINYNYNYSANGPNFNIINNENKIYSNIMSHNNTSYVITFGHTGTNYISKKNYNKLNKNIKLPKRILDYLQISKSECSTNELKTALIEKSDNNKKIMTIKNPSKHHYHQSTIFLDKKGKDLFNIKGNFITIDCLMDILLNEYVPDLPDYDFLEVNQNPIEVKNLNFNFLFSNYD
jgi:hypothetical protein